MASKPSKPKPCTFPLMLFLIALFLFTIHYLRLLHSELKITLPNPKSPRNPNWFGIIAQELRNKNIINIGLVNMDNEMTIKDEIKPKRKIVKVLFDRADKRVQWSDLFPGWINEKSRSKCPELPLPKFENYHELDVVVSRVPCGEYEESGVRDVFRLQVNLVVANLLVRSGRVGNNGVDREVFAVFVGSCGPMWEIFRCDDLLLHVGNYRVYRPELRRIRQKVLMPVGSCQLSPPFAQSGEELWRWQSNKSHNDHTFHHPREAYVTVLHSSDAYVCGAITLAQSIIQSNSTKDLILLADDHISPKALDGLRSAGWKIKRIQRIRSPFSKKNTYNEWNYSKLRIWQLNKYDKVMFIDSDFIITRNMDHFFIHPQLAAVGDHNHFFNSGLMLVEPSMCTFKTLMKKRWVVRSYNEGDQGFLNEMFSWWHRLPRKTNRFKYFDSGDDDHEHQLVDDDHMYALHYFGFKPWMCYRDYDCNWDRKGTQRYASDSANERWWRIHDTMPEKLREYCSLTPEMNARIRKHRYDARNTRFADGHWKIKVMDPRQNIK